MPILSRPDAGPGLPVWWDCDFCYTRDGLTLSASCPNAADGDFGRLWINRWKGDYPFAVEGGLTQSGAGEAIIPATLVSEDSGIRSCSLTSYPDGRVGLWYVRRLHLNRLVYRESVDSGLTWSEPTEYDFGFIDEAALVSDLRLGTNWGSHYWPVCYEPRSGLIVTLKEVFVSPLGIVWRLLVARRDAAGTGWEWSDPTPCAASDGGQPGAFLNLQPLRDGSVAVLGLFAELQNIESDGTHLWRDLHHSPDFFKSNLSAAWIDERLGILLATRWTYGFPMDGGDDPLGGLGDAGHIVTTTNAYGIFGNWSYPALDWWIYRRRADSLWEWLGAYPWFRTLNSVYSKWNLGVRSASYEWKLDNWGGFGEEAFNYDLRAEMLKCRSDGIWDLLRVNPDGDLEFARCRSLPNSGVTIWEGR